MDIPSGTSGPRALVILHQWLFPFIVLMSCNTEVTASCTYSVSSNNITQLADSTCALTESVFRNITSKSVITLSPGNYTLQSVLSIANVSDVILQGGADMNFTIVNGTDYVSDQTTGTINVLTSRTVIWCNSSGGGLKFRNVSNLSLTNFTLVGCGNGSTLAAIQLNNVSNFRMSGVTVLDSCNTSALNGSAVTGNSYISSSYFVGGENGVVLESSTVSIWSSTFGNYNRSGIMSAGNTSIEISDCNFVYDRTGINTTTTPSSVSILNSTFDNCKYGIKTKDTLVGITTTVNLFSSQNVINSTFSNNLYGIFTHINTSCDGCSFIGNSFGVVTFHNTFAVSNTSFSNESESFSAVNAVVQMGGKVSFLGGSLRCAAAVNSKLNVTGSLTFSSCRSCCDGGALYLSETEVTFLAPANITFSSNLAGRGGAVFVAPRMQLFVLERCFFQFWDSVAGTSLANSFIRLNFNNNHGHRGGNDFFADITNCVLDNNAEGMNYGLTSLEDVLRNVTTGVSFARNLTTRSISFEPVKVCFCDKDGSVSPGCSQTLNLTVFPGQMLNLSVTSLDQYNQIVPSEIFLGSEERLFIEYQLVSQEFKCSNYTISREITYGTNNITLLMNTDRTLTLLKGSQTVTSSTINLIKLDCPPGFTLIDNKTCNCSKYLQDNKVQCDIDSVSFIKTLQTLEVGWIGSQHKVSNDSLKTIWYSDTCPFEFCDDFLSIVQSGKFDEQCRFNRSGVMCGDCSTTLSNIFGEFQCQKCSNEHISLLVVFAVLGVALVAFLSLLDITVTNGTITGLIFYANILNTVCTVYFPPDINDISYIRFLYVFVSWINLDFGINACFYNGMTNIDKAGLQFAFTAYVLLIVGFIVLASRCCVTCSVLRQSNVVPVLATLILLSFNKIFNSVVNIFQYSSVCNASDGTPSLVWMSDGNVQYATGKHAYLMAFGVFLTVFVICPFVLLILFSPCLQRVSHLKGFRWVNHLKPFLDSYQAPYKDNFRFWTGILLLARIVLSVLAVVIVANKAVIAFATNLIPLVLLVAFVGLRVYKSWKLVALEAFFYFNLIVIGLVVLFSFATRYEVSLDSKETKYIEAVIITCVGSAFLCFVGIVIYHLCLKIKKYRSRKPSRPVSIHLNIETEDLTSKEAESEPRGWYELRESIMDD